MGESLVFWCIRCDMALAKSVRLPSPTLIKVSMAETSAKASTLSSNCAIGVRCLIFEKVLA